MFNSYIGLNISRILLFFLMPVQDMLFGACLNPAFIAVLRKNASKPEPLELIEVETFKVRFQDCCQARDAEKAKDKVLAKEPDVEMDEATKIERGVAPPTPGKYQKGTPEYWTATAAQLCDIYVLLHAEPQTEAAMVKAIAESSLAPTSIRGKPGRSCVLIHLDTQLIGEASKRPAYKLPPIPDGLMSKLLTAALKARGAQPVKGSTHFDAPIEGDVVLLNDGGRNDADACLSHFKTGKTRRPVNAHIDHWDLSLVISQETLKLKRKKNRGALNQALFFLAMTKT